jgi:hypothetical protein
VNCNLEIIHSILEGKLESSREDIEQLTGMIRDLYRDTPNVVDKTHSFVFLGDYGDRGPAQIETINLVMALAISDSERVIMIRGNHESDEVAQQYGFYSEVTRKFPVDVYSKYLEVFQVLPMAVYNSDGIFACHGGIPEAVTSLDDIQKCNRFNLNFPDDILFQLVWNDPKEADFKFAANSRGNRVKAFGRQAFDEFSENLGVKLMFRAHEVFAEGYRKFFDGRLVSVFSAAYRGAAVPTVLRLSGDFKVDPIKL